MPRMPHHIRERLNSWNLKRIPFPAVPIIDPYNSDPLQNGSVFEPSLRQSEIDHIRRDVFGGGYPEIAQLWSWVYARRKYGRNVGMGKTALLVYLTRIINQDYGQTFFGRAAHWLCLYTLLPAKIRTLNELLVHMLLALSHDVHGKSVVELLRARLRRMVLMRDLAGPCSPVLHTSREHRFVNDQWLIRNGVDLPIVDAAVESFLSQSQIASTVAHAFATNSLNDHLLMLNGSVSLTQLRTNLINAAPDLFLNQIARIVQLAGIARLTILLDDFYRLIIRTPPSDRTELAAEIRAMIRDGDYVANHSNLYTWMAVIHTTTAGKFSAAWENRDLHHIANLNYQHDTKGTALQPIPFSAGRQILEAYISSQRTSRKALSLSFPFTSEALEEIARIASDQVSADPNTCEPRSLLLAAFEVAREALLRDELGLPIDGFFVQHVLQGAPLPTSLREIDSEEDIAPSEAHHPIDRACPCNCHKEVGKSVQDAFAILDGGSGSDTTRKILGHHCRSCNQMVVL